MYRNNQKLKNTKKKRTDPFKESKVRRSYYLRVEKKTQKKKIEETAEMNFRYKMILCSGREND